MNPNEIKEIHTNAIKADVRMQERYNYADKAWDMAIEANIAGLISNDEFTTIAKSLEKIDPLVGIKY
jgi:hypothetical protein